MMTRIMVVVVAVIFSGCAPVLRVHIPETSPFFRIGAIKNVPAIHSRSILFINEATATWQRCLVFEGYYSLDQLFREGGDGLPELQVVPVGYFKIGPQIGRVPAEELGGYFEPRQDYTILCFLENVLGGVVDIDVVHAAIGGRDFFRYRYVYTNTFGLRAEKWINCLVRLPYHHPRRNTAPIVQVNLNELVRKLFRLLGSGDLEIEPEEEGGAE